MEDQDGSELEKVQAEKNQLKKILEGITTQLKKAKQELEGTRKKLKKAEYERDNAENYVTNLKQEVAILNKELHEERQRRKEDQKIRDVEVVKEASTKESPTSGLDANNLQDENKDLKSVLKEAASAAMTNSGLVYDDRTGLYYDWNSGLYYDPHTCLYYNNKTGTYYYYNETSGKYEFHSQVELQNDVSQNQGGNDTEKDASKVKIRIKENREQQKKKESKPTIYNNKDDDDDNCNDDDDDDDEYSSGEIIDSDDSDDDMASTDDDVPPVPVIAPCIRAIVTQSNKLKVGTLFIVPCTGGTLGREKDVGHLIRIPDLEISKHHCNIRYDEERRQYFICDLASRNGSFLNSQRLSQPKEQSEAHVLTHGDMLAVGGTTLLLHVHPGTETCNDCEPGQVQAQAANDVAIASNTAENSRKKQLKMLKRAYGLEKEAFHEPNETTSKGKYRNRAELRRVKIGSDVPNGPDAAPSSVHRPIESQNKGRKMLEKMGWKTGEGLGREGAGRTEPVIANIRERKRGLGGGIKRSLDEAHLSSNNSSYLRLKTKERYDKIVGSSNTTTETAQKKTDFVSEKDTTHKKDKSETNSQITTVDKDIDMFAD